MKAERHIPCDILKPYVNAFVVTETAEEKIYKVLPGTALVIGFQYKGSLSRIDNGQQVQLASSGLTGLHDRYKVFKSATHIGTILVYFKEAGAATFFRQPIHELFQESISLEHFMLRSELLLLEEKICEAKTDLIRIHVVENFLISRMTSFEQDKLVLTALALIHKSKGNIRVTELTKQLHISQSPLEKRFRKIVGTSPKKFASIVRFKHTLQNYNPQNSIAGLGYEAGFYDQAHFIKEFKNFTGDTPETFFRSKQNDFLQS
jgi:AraC-like DNA-binding protein